MSQVHGKNVWWSINGAELYLFGNATDPERTADTHDTTTYHPTRKSKTYKGGLLDGTSKVGGLYDSGPTGPAAILEPLLGETVVYVYRPEGVGSGKPEKSVSVIVGKYTESGPVGDMIRWSCDLQFTGDVTITTQA